MPLILGPGSPATDIKPSQVQDQKREEGMKREPVITSNTPATNTTASNGSAKILSLGGSSAFQPIHKAKDSLPKENGKHDTGIL